LHISACYSWEMALTLRLNVSFDTIQDWKKIREAAWEVILRKLL
jgi:hypothetical protein